MSPNNRNSSKLAASLRHRRRARTPRATPAPMAKPIPRPPIVPQARSITAQRQPKVPMSCSPSRPSPRKMNGNAVPSLSPPSPVSAKRRLSRSCGLRSWTSDASTGSVGASAAPSSSASPGAIPSPQWAAAAMPAMVSTSDRVASLSGRLQRQSPTGTRILMPTVNSAINSAISVTSSSISSSRSGCSSSASTPEGPSANPTSR